MEQMPHDNASVLLHLAEMPESDILFELGRGFQYEYSKPGVKYSAPYLELGKHLWESFSYELQQLICQDGKPRPWVKEASGGDKRDLAVGILTAITSNFDVTLGIAIPAAAMFIKRGAKPYCSDVLEKPKKTVAEILREKRTKMRT